ncbi:lactonase family protein [Pseudomonas alcaligenes]|uniref:lactonase family protein n=1 Tax=Pseudomonas sp. RIT-PI-AD TaxID=3035294 RepID=UPI0021D800DE
MTRANPSGKPPAHFNLLVGTYTAGASEGIQVFHFDDAAGRIGELRFTAPCSNPSWLTLSADGRQLYAVSEDGGESPDMPGERRGQVSHFQFDAASGRLDLHGSQASKGDHPTHSSLSPDQRYLFVANYSADAEPGSLVVLPVAADGTLGAARHVHRHPVGSHGDAERQAHGHVHCARISPDGWHLYVADLGADRVFVHRYDVHHPANPLQTAGPASFQAPTGSGPRHLVFSADGRFAYLTLELSGEVMALAVERGELRAIQTERLAPPGFGGAVAAGSLHLSADGRFLHVLDRGDHNHLVVYRVDPAKGTLECLQRRSCEGREPREMALSPSGRFLLLANQGSDRIHVLARDPESGRLGETLQTVSVGAPSDFVFVALP